MPAFAPPSQPLYPSLVLYRYVLSVACSWAIIPKCKYGAPGGSLGPEAALLALCGATTSWVARKGLGFTGHRLRNMTLLGMTAGLAAFFGVALGGKCHYDQLKCWDVVHVQAACCHS